jgi:hypothetical protein
MFLALFIQNKDLLTLCRDFQNDARKLVRSAFRFHMVFMATFNIVDKVRVVRVLLIGIVSQFCNFSIKFTSSMQDYTFGLVNIHGHAISSEPIVKFC